MGVPLLYLRDQVLVGTELRNRLYRLCGQQPKGQTVIIASRHVRHDPPDYQLIVGPGKPGEPDLTGLNLLVVTDHYDAPFGSINGSGFAGQPGTPGNPGGNSEGIGEPGGAGGPGGPALPGTPASGNVTVLAHRYALGPVTADGGTGANGGAGGDGGSGGDGVKGIPGKVDPEPAGVGGAGGPGGSGSAGGGGGIVTLGCVNGTPTGSARDGAGGRGGTGGKGGQGGSPPNLRGADGATGADGAGGTGGRLTVLSLTDSAPTDPVPGGTYWPRVVAAFGPAPNGTALADAWADWRTRMGEYYFRTYHRVAAPENLQLAHGECVAALRLNSQAAYARTLVQYLANGVNVLGLSRQAWVPPTFEAYQQVATTFHGLVNGSVGNIVTLVNGAADVAQNVQTLAQQASQLERKREAFADEVAQAGVLLQESKVREAAARQRLQQLRAQAVAAQAALEAAQMQVEQHQVWTTIGTVYSVVVAVAQIIAGVVTENPMLVVGGVAQLGPIIEGQSNQTINVSPLTGTIQAAVKDDEGITKWLEADGFYDPSPETVKAIKAGGGGLVELMNGTASYLNKEKALAQADSAKYSNLASQYTGLVRQMILDTAAVYAAQLDRVAASLGLDAANARQDANERDIAALRNATTIQTAGLAALAPGLRTLLGTARLYQDAITRYVFLAARAADEWTLGSVGDSVPMDTGYVHPDSEERAFFDLQYPLGPGAEGDASQIRHYAQQAAGGWAAIPEMTYQAAYDRYNQSLNTATVFVHLVDPALLEQFRTSHTVTFTIATTQVPAGRAELKIDRLRLALLGATSTNPTFDCLLTHGGDMLNTRVADGAVVEIHAPATGPVTVAARMTPFTADDPTGLQNVRQQFWGRSPHASWTLRVEQAILDTGNVDLSGLTEIALQLNLTCKVSVAPMIIGPQALNRWRPVSGQLDHAEGALATTIQGTDT